MNTLINLRAGRSYGISLVRFQLLIATLIQYSQFSRVLDKEYSKFGDPTFGLDGGVIEIKSEPKNQTNDYYPWAVFVKALKHCQDPHDFIWNQCNGVLISYRHVLVAAHCMIWNMTKVSECVGIAESDLLTGNKFVQSDELIIRYGTNDMNSGSGISASKISVPELYVDSTEFEPRRFDIAIIRLKYRIDRKIHDVTPICLTTEFNAWGDQITTHTFGWQIKDFFPKFSFRDNLLKVVQQQIPSSDYCDRIFTQYGFDSDPQLFLCTRASTHHKMRFEGSMQFEKNGHFYLAGMPTLQLLKDENEMRDAKFADVHTKMSSYCGFISAATRSEVNCLVGEYNGSSLLAECGRRT
uniref:Peptidase S1 domain-containing protein n=1 Tax=Globodera rostochiensis TaxID=31243 RepID=A0A914HF56_GLORO